MIQIGLQPHLVKLCRADYCHLELGNGHTGVLRTFPCVCVGGGEYNLSHVNDHMSPLYDGSCTCMIWNITFFLFCLSYSFVKYLGKGGGLAPQPALSTSLHTEILQLVLFGMHRLCT